LPAGESPWWRGGGKKGGLMASTDDLDESGSETTVVTHPRSGTRRIASEVPSHELATQAHGADPSWLAEPTTESRSKTLLRFANVDLVSEGALFFSGDLPGLSWGPGSFVPIAASDLAELARQLIRHRADQKDVGVVLRCTCRRVWVHRQAFVQALYELLDNAVQATPAQHCVIVDACEVGEGDMLWQILDRGHGMHERVLADLGQPPYVASGRTCGLGVALAWAVVERHGGLLRFESAPAVGTTVSIWLPGRV
jgi:hypothetical protein